MSSGNDVDPDVPPHWCLGDPKRRIYAAIKFFLFTMAGSVLMLVAILILYFLNQRLTGVSTFDVLELYKLGLPLGRNTGSSQLCPGLCHQSSDVPVSYWLPDAHTEAPTAGSVILAGVLLKMGTYGFIRFAIPCFRMRLSIFCPCLCFGPDRIIYGAWFR